jgi:hypothetical protein
MIVQCLHLEMPLMYPLILQWPVNISNFSEEVFVFSWYNPFVDLRFNYVIVVHTFWTNIRMFLFYILLNHFVPSKTVYVIYWQVIIYLGVIPCKLFIFQLSPRFSSATSISARHLFVQRPELVRSCFCIPVKTIVVHFRYRLWTFFYTKYYT